MPRPTVRGMFVDPPKGLEVSFHTSSTDKFLQARMVFQDCGLVLRHFRSSQDPYDEDYDLGQRELLVRAIKQIKNRLGVNSLFFVEDTSLKIDALSLSDKVVPGLEVKEWFARTSFADLDAELRAHGNNREATVSSDIALHVPGLRRVVLIHGDTSGRVAATPPTFARSDQWPWLTPDTFNGWFVPAGASKRLGEMSFEESIEHDFRVRAFLKLIDRLEEYAAILNLSGTSYSVRRLRKETDGPSLFGSLYLVIGKMCAGKTTLGQYATSHHSYRFIEASSILRMIAERDGITAPNAFYLAKEVLERQGPDIVAREIVGMYDPAHDTVVTGFRTIEEVQYTRSHLPDCKVVFIDASERTRFERHLARGRLDEIQTLRDFQEHDRRQWAFGLLPVACDLANVRIENEGTMSDFHAQIDAVIRRQYSKVPGVSDVKPQGSRLQETRVFRCLRALEHFDGPVSCPQIAEWTERETPPADSEHVERISARHVNWVLRDIPELVRRIDARGDRVRYQILPAGRAYLEAVRSMKD